MEWVQDTTLCPIFCKNEFASPSSPLPTLTQAGIGNYPSRWNIAILVDLGVFDNSVCATMKWNFIVWNCIVWVSSLFSMWLSGGRPLKK